MSIQNWPNAVFEPHTNSRMKPHTVGGSTIGMVKMASKMLFARGEGSGRNMPPKDPG